MRIYKLELYLIMDGAAGYSNVRLKRLLRKSQFNDMDDNGNPIKKQFHILYFGDYDPTSRRIDLNLSLDLFSRRDLAIENLKKRAKT